MHIFTQVCVQFATENGQFKLHWANIIPLCVYFLHHFVTAEHKNVRRVSLEMFTSYSATSAIPTFCQRHCCHGLQRRQTGLLAALNDDWRKEGYCLLWVKKTPIHSARCLTDRRYDFQECQTPSSGR